MPFFFWDHKFKDKKKVIWLCDISAILSEVRLKTNRIRFKGLEESLNEVLVAIFDI